MTAREWLARFDAALVVAPARRRALHDELAAHFADAIDAGESEAAVARAVGSPERVAARCSREAGVVAVERALWFVVGGVGVLGLYWLLGWFAYPLGHWRSPPHVLYAPHHLGLGAWAATGVLGLAALLALRSGASRREPALALGSAVVLVALVALHLGAGTIYVWLRNGIVAGSPSPGLQAVFSALHVALGAAAVLPLVRAARRLAACRG